MNDARSGPGAAGDVQADQEPPTRQINGVRPLSGSRSSSGRLRSVASCVTPGVWATAVPFPSFLEYSFSYSVRVPDGVILIDLGWDSDEAWQALLLGLSRAGVELTDVIGVVATHAHPDHLGLASRLREVSDAWVVGHSWEEQNLLGTLEARRQRASDVEDWLVQCAVPVDSIATLLQDAVALTDPLSEAGFDSTLEDGDTVPGSGGTLQVVHTPGHTPGHLCVVDRRRNLMFTGDHLLPRVTPNVSKRPGSLDDPLTAYERSLEVTASFGEDLLLLPGHEWSFDRPAERVAELTTHTRTRLDEAKALVGQQRETTWEVATAMSWSREFDSLNVRGQRQALGETHATLFSLAARGQIAMEEGSPTRWRPSGSG